MTAKPRYAALLDQPPAFLDLTPGRVESICVTALAEPDRHAALRFLQAVIPEAETPLLGVRNEGLFATHELSVGVPYRTDWVAAQQKAGTIRDRRGKDLFEHLGFTLEALPGPASLLRARESKVAVAVFLERHESPDVAQERFSGLSPVSYALTKADTENLPYVVVSAGPRLRLYSTQPGVGTGRRGRTETFLELHVDLLSAEQAGYLWLFFSADALRRNGSVKDVLAASSRYALSWVRACANVYIAAWFRGWPRDSWRPANCTPEVRNS